jgi:hypothetical protein
LSVCLPRGSILGFGGCVGLALSTALISLLGLLSLHACEGAYS